MLIFFVLAPLLVLEGNKLSKKLIKTVQQTRCIGLKKLEDSGTEIRRHKMC